MPSKKERDRMKAIKRSKRNSGKKSKQFISPKNRKKGVNNA